MPRDNSPAAGPARPCILARVSSDEQAQDGYSLDEQVYRCRQWCETMLGVTVPDSAVYREEGVSGRPADVARRPGLAAARQGCLDGSYTHLVVHKLDRLARNVGLIARLLDELDAAGVGVVIVALDGSAVDTRSALGRLFVSIMATMAQFTSDNIGEEVKKGKEGKRRQGLSAGVLPVGLVWGPDGIPVADERPVTLTGGHTAPRIAMIHEVFARAAECASLGEIAQSLQRQGWLTQGTQGVRPISRSTVAKILANRSYLGEIPDGAGAWQPGAHQPVIARDLWDAVQAARAARRAHPRSIPGGARVHALGGGIVRCAACQAAGRTGVWHVQDTRRGARLACHNRVQARGCQEPSVAMHTLEWQVGVILEQCMLPPAVREQVVAAYVADRAAASDGTPDPAAQLAALDARLARIRDLYVWGHLPREQYERDWRAAEDERATLTRASAVQPTAQHLEDLAGDLANLAGAWRDASPARRADLARELFSALYARGQEIVAVLPTPDYAPFFQAIAQAEPGAAFSNAATGSHTEAFPSGALLVRRGWAIPVARRPVDAATRQIIVARAATGEPLKRIARDLAIPHATVWRIGHAARKAVRG